MKRRDTLVDQIIAVNVLLVIGTLFGASVAVGLDLTERSQQFIVLGWGIALTLVVNWVLLKRRFAPLERLIEQVERIDPAHPGEPIDAAGEVEEVTRLAASFERLLDRVEAERVRAGKLVLRAQEEERGRIARDLHDEVNQALTAVLLRLEALDHDAPPELRAELAETKRIANQAMEELLRLARQLRPSALDDHGVVAAIDTQLKRFSDQTGVDVEVRTRGRVTTLSEDQESVLYRVVQEALSNVAQHARATRVALDLVAAERSLTLRMRDDGVGFEGGDGNGAPSPSGRIGLEGMAERARLVGGELNVVSAPGQGTVVTLRFPHEPTPGAGASERARSAA